MEYPTPNPVQGPARTQQEQGLELQQHAGKDFMDGMANTAAGSIARTVSDEGTLYADQTSESLKTDDPALAMQSFVNRLPAQALTIFGFRAGEADYDKEKEASNLTDGIPYEFWDDILEEDNLDAALRARARVLDTIDRGRRMSAQHEGQIAQFAGNMVDVDLPLTALSGGAFGAAKMTRGAYRLSTGLGVSARGAGRIANTATYANAGFQAGVLVGGLQAASSDTDGWEDFANVLLSSTAMGGALGAVMKPAYKAATDEFVNNIATDNPGFHKPIDVNTQTPDDFRNFVETNPDDSLSAAAALDSSTMKMDEPKLGEPHGPISPTSNEIIDMTRTWRHNSDWGDRKAADLSTTWGKIASSGAANVFNDDFNRLFKSKSSVANYLSGTILESANGLGRGKATAAVRQENYHRRIQTPIARTWFNNLSSYARESGQTMAGSGYGWNRTSKAQFNREVMLEMNDRRMGRLDQSSRSMYVRKAADDLETSGQESLRILKGRDGERPVDGFEDFDTNVRGYSPYRWKGARIVELEKAGVVTRKSLTADLARGYEAAGMASGKDAEAVANAVIKRAVAHNFDVDTNIASLLAADGKDWLREALLDSGTDAQKVEGIMDRLIGNQHDRAKEGFAKARNDIDLASTLTTTDGSTLQIVDIMDNDVHGTWQRYSRRVAGSSALARHGITNRAMREEFITAMRKEQEGLGEEATNPDLLRAIFSHFDGAAVQGFAQGKVNKGINPTLGVAKRMVNLGLLEKLGITQLAELGMGIMQNGIGNFVQRGLRPMFDRAVKDSNRKVLDELEFLTGEIGRDQWHFAQWMDMDDLNRSDMGMWMKGVNRITGGASAVQAYTNGFNQIRSFQQRTAALGVSDKIFRTLKKSIDSGENLDDAFRKRAEGDLGLFPEDLNTLSNLVENGVIEFSKGGQFVNRLNFEQWDPETAEIFGAAVGRNINQIVQKSLAGEQSAWMHTDAGALLMHLKSFAATSIQKQFARNIRYADPQMIAMIAMASATSALSVMVKNAVNGREQDAKEIAKGAFNYHNMFGWIPTVADPMLSVVGLDEARFNPYGPNSGILPPVATVGMDLMRAPGGLANAAAGTADYYDWKAIKALPFMGTYGISRIFD